ncbi:hypothetical protein DEA06_14330 [Microbacterium sp. Gd 4-13]|uniref:hypothetical protein n=1 Tax=Microbacterium sp. Gd 4-13 TaxID=2173179 RepID=UPI000D580613|nr:hypothetical protein [Microbacterium sp. Gd 4-13]PVW02950.1 hypothetical protein DEA06_14330 [Microbacterium sp. Gd 4-13]
MDEASPFFGPGSPASKVPVVARGEAIYTAVPETPAAPVRHLLGYEPFTSLCVALGVEPRQLATITTFGDFVRSHRDAVLDGGLNDAAAVFLGNVLVSYRFDAHWVRYGDHFPSAGTDEQAYEVLHLLALLMDSDDSTYRTCLEMIEGWAQPQPAEPTL